jgi:predicted permease
MSAFPRLASRLYALTLFAFPKRHRDQYREEMVDAFTHATRSCARQHGAWAAVRFVIGAMGNAVVAGLGERRRSRRFSGSRRGFSAAALGRDLSHSVRALSKARAFTAVCAGSLGIGMGTVIAVLVVLRGLTAAPPGVKAEGLTELLIRPLGSLRAQTGGRPIETWSFPDFKDVRDANTGMSVTGWAVERSWLLLPGGSGATPVATMYVSPNYFANVGVRLAQGRTFDAAEGTDSSAPPVVILSHEMWQNHLGSDPSIVGRTITLNREDHAVIGIAPRGFQSHVSPENGPGIDMWAPLGRHPRIAGSDSLQSRRDIDWVRVMGRLSSGTTLAQAGAAVSSVMAGIAEQFPDTNNVKQASVEPYFAMGARNRMDVVLLRASLLTVAGFILLIVCVNISGMVLVRSAARERELAVRLAMGASRGRLIQYLLAECTVLALVSGAVTAAILFGGPRILIWWYNTPPSADLDLLLRLDGWVVAVCIGTCFVTSLVFGLLPAVRFSRPTLVSALKDETGTAGRRTGKVHRWATALQAGIAVPFLVMSGVALGEFRANASADLGFRSEGVFAASLDLEGAGYQGPAATSYLRTVQNNLRQSAGVTAVSVAEGIPLDGRHRVIRDARLVPAHATRVDANYLETLGTRVVRGRGITAADDAGSELVAVISEPLAARLFPESDPLGQKLTFAIGQRPQQFTIVGVTADGVTAQMGSARPQLFVPLAQHPVSRVLLVVRSAAGERATRDTFAEAFTGLEPESVRARVVSADELVRSGLNGLRTETTTAGVLGAVALMLTALGVFGVIGFMVATRTRELGVRMALGASSARVLDMVLRDTFRLVAPGVAVGLALSAVLLWSQGMSWYAAPLAYAFAAATTVSVGLLSGLPAARRAAAVEPLIAMRAE